MTGAVPVDLRPGRPLTPMQRPLWMSQRRHPDAPVQNMALLTHIDGPVDAGRLGAAFARVVAASDVLRTRITDIDGAPRVTLDADDPDTDVIDLDRDQTAAWARDRAAVPIDMARRGHDSVVVRHPDGTCSWYLALHHTITDATSSALVFAATAAAYHGTEPELDPYYPWTATLADQPRRDQAVAHWRNREAAPAIDRLYRSVRTGAGSGSTPEAVRLGVDLDAGLAAAVGDRLDGEFALLSPDLSWTALLITVTAAYLHQLAGVDRVAIGLPVHNRAEPAARNLIGPLMEVFPVDVTVEAGDTFRSLHKRASRAVMTTLGRAVPGTAPSAGDVAAVVNVIPRGALGPFGPVPTRTRWIPSGAIDASHLLRVQLTAYAGDNADSTDNADGTDNTDGTDNADGTDNTDGTDNADGPVLAIDLNTAGAGPEHRERAAGHLRSLLAAATADPDRPVAGSLVSPDELALLSAWESASPDFATPTSGLVPQLAEALAGRTSVALRDGERTWTGADLWHRAGEVAATLRSEGVGPGRRVGIEMARSAEAVIAILATLRAGGSFVPLDPAQPAARRRSLAERAGCDPVLTALPDSRPEVPGPGTGTEASIPGPEDEAYLLFTSGSTGEPKGVPISHLGIARYLRFAAESYLDNHPAGPDGRALVVPLFSALTFDLTMTSLFLPLLAGGELVVIRPDGPAGLAAIAADRRFDWCKATPSHLEVLARMLPSDHALATVVVGGEAFGAGLARRLLAHRSDLAVFNEYGPTEAVVGCMIHRVDPAELAEGHEVPIGRPAPGVTLRIVSPELERLPIGAAGELLIAHAGLTPGYLVPSPAAPTADGGARAAEARAEQEPAGPFVELDGMRFYRSGDLVRLADPTTAVYLGRIDEQVKVGGIRLEPTEVEDALASHPAIARAAVRLWSPRTAPPSRRCVRCGLPDNVPGASFDDAGVCRSCHDYDRVAPQAKAWFRTVDDLRAKRDEARQRRQGRYDCLHLLSGGKDSTYALYQLVALGFEPFALTLDNGWISEEAKANIRRSVADLGIDHEFATPATMDAIFRDSLERHSNVCHGCYKTIYTLATTRAVELGIPLIVTGLSRGQLFETRLIPAQFRAERFDPDAIDRAVVEARRAYHRIDDGPRRLLDTSVFDDGDLFDDGDVFDRVEYLDFYRYIDVELGEMLSFLDNQAPWVRPRDTGRSTNCLINAAGIATHLREQGYHNYAIPYAWDVRLGHKARDEAIAELDDQLDEAEVGRMLDAVGYTPNPPRVLTAWLQPADGVQSPPSPAELRAYLADLLPAHAIPAAFVEVDHLPMTANGKLDSAALPSPERTHRSSTGIVVAPETELEATVVAVWERILHIEPIAVDDDFFALGGDSLGALEMIVALAEATGTLLPDEAAFLHPTPRTLAAALDEAGAGAAPAGPDGSTPAGTSPAPTTSGPDTTGTATTGGPVPLGPWTADDPPPLSDGELAILFEQSRHPGSVLYNVGRLYRVHGPVDGAALAQAVRSVAADHVPLSWTYGANRRHLPPDQAVEVTVVGAAQPANDLGPAASAVHRRPFDLDQGPLLRVWVQPLDDGTTAVLLACHHVSGDAIGFDRLWNQIDHRLAGTPTPHPALEADYPSVTRWQASLVTDDDRNYWRSQPPADPSALHRPHRAGPDGFITRPASVTARDLRSRAGATGFTLALAAVAATLRRYHRGDRVEVSTIVSTRAHPAADRLVGYFLNTLPTALDVPPTSTLGQLSTAAGAVAAANLAHRHYPWSRLVADRRDAGRAEPDLRVLFAYDELPALTLGGRQVDQQVLSNGAAVGDLTFFVEVRPDTGQVDLSVEHRGAVIDADTAGRLLDDLDVVLRAAVDQPATPVGDLGLASPPSILHGPALAPPDSLLPSILGQARSRPGAEAVQCGADRVTWGGLDQRSRDLAHRLRAAGVGPGDRVLVCLPRSVDLVVAIVAVLRAGGAYVPIDPSYPADRIELIAGRAGAVAAVTDTLHPEGPDQSYRLPVPTVLTVAGSPSGDGDRGGAAPATTDADAAYDDAGVGAVTGSGPAYVMFTSGSTGRPRGVPVTHGQLAASTAARSGVYPERPERFLMVSSPAFDSSVVGLFWTLAAGGTVILPTEAEVHDPDALVDLLERSAATHVLTVPTLYQSLLERGRDRAVWPERVIVAGEACPGALVSRHGELRPASRLTNEYGPTEATVWATAHQCRPGDDPVPIGEPIPGSWVAVVDSGDRPVPFGVEGQLIVGGPGVVDGYLDEPEATARRFGAADGDGPLPAGRYFRTGDRAVIVDGRLDFLGRIDDQLNLGGVRAEPEDIERVLLGHPGVGAVVVTVTDPRPLAELLEAAPPAVLAEAMAAAATAPDPAADLARRLQGADPSQLRLVAHIEPVAAGAAASAAGSEAAAADLTASSPNPAELRELARAGLPPLLRPSLYVFHPRLPRSPNGKVDRAAAQRLTVPVPSAAAPLTTAGPSNPALSNPSSGQAAASAGPAPAGPGAQVGSGLVEDLRGLLASVLRLPVAEVPADGSFFDLGGHSLLAMELLLAIERRFGADLSVADLYQQPTPAGLAAVLQATAPADPVRPNRFLIPIQPRGTKPPIFGIHVLGADSAFYRPLAARLGDDQPLFGLGLPTLRPDTTGPTDVAEVAARYADEIEQCAPDGPVTLAAVSLGSVVAFELAHQLRFRGRTVALVALFDAAGPHAVELALGRAERLAVHARALRADPGLYARGRAANVRARLARRTEQVAARARGRLGLELGRDLQIREFVEANWRSQRAYRFEPYPGRLVVFKAGDDPFTASLAAGGAGWRPVVTGPFELEVVPGGHLSMLAEPHVAVLAERFAAAQERALAAAATEADRGGAGGGATGPVSRDALDSALRQALAQGRFGVEVARWLDRSWALSTEASILLEQADKASRTIAADTALEADRVVDALDRHGIAARPEPVPERLASHQATVRVASLADHAARCQAALHELGYRRQDGDGDGDSDSTQQASSGPASLSFIRLDEVTTRVRLVDHGPPPPTTAVTTTTAAAAVTADAIPERLYVGTPAGLAGEVLALAAPGPDDLVVDVGCGDGRVLIEAVRRFGCRARGVEIDPALAAEARERVTAAGLADRIDIVEGDAADVGLDGATVAFCFLPPPVTARLLGPLLAQLPAGGRLVAHEQLAFDWPVAPTVSQLVLGPGVTVAHLWTAPGPDR